MARPLRIEYPGAFYHVMSRGNERKDIYRSGRDRDRFLSYLGSASLRYRARVHAYCLMSNHYHLLVETPEANLSQIMRHINGAYTTYFNVKWGRAGHLLQGRYKAILVERDEYALELSRYIHRNPVRAGIVERPEDYRWSSCRAYAGQSAPPEWLVREDLLASLGVAEDRAQARYAAFVQGAGRRESVCPWDQVVGSVLLGSEGFVEWVKREFLDSRPCPSDIPSLKAFVDRPTIAEVREFVNSRMDGDRRWARRVSLYLCQKHTGRKLREIGEAFGVGESAVSRAARRLAAQLAEDEQLAKRVSALERDLGVSRVKN